MAIGHRTYSEANVLVSRALYTSGPVTEYALEAARRSISSTPELDFRPSQCTTLRPLTTGSVRFRRPMLERGCRIDRLYLAIFDRTTGVRTSFMMEHPLQSVGIYLARNRGVRLATRPNSLHMPADRDTASTGPVSQSYMQRSHRARTPTARGSAADTRWLDVSARNIVAFAVFAASFPRASHTFGAGRIPLRVPSCNSERCIRISCRTPVLLRHAGGRGLKLHGAGPRLL